MPTHIEYDPDADVYRVSLEGATDRTTVGVIVDAVAEIDDVDPTDLASLSTRMDPEAMDALLASAADAPHGESVRVEFSCWGYRVTVLPGEAIVRPEGIAGRKEEPSGL